ncbi:hypothetical protein BGY98DRAFT_729324 [Russula aff. rugulosa BPL654]|nr:hypothetical protein BGY98DRAFT_729324 [Russula aff. rugulosa BPL654]
MIPCAVTILVLYLHLFFYISRGLDTNRSIVVTPLQRPIIYLMTTHTLFIASSSLLLRPICAVPSLSLAEFVSPRLMVDNVAISSPKLARRAPLHDSLPRSIQTALLSKRRSPPHPYYSPLFVYATPSYIYQHPGAPWSGIVYPLA